MTAAHFQSSREFFPDRIHRVRGALARQEWRLRDRCRPQIYVKKGKYLRISGSQARRADSRRTVPRILLVFGEFGLKIV